MRLQLDQRSQEWHEWRKGGIGASDAATILGLNPYKTPHHYWLVRTNRIEPEEANAAMRYGILHEDGARANYAAKYGRGMAPVCYQHDDFPFMRASLDGICCDGKHVVDFKVPNPWNYETIKTTRRVPDYWTIQVQFQMLCCGAETGELSVFNPTSGESIEIPVKRDEQIERDLIQAATVMWDCIQNDIEPEMTDVDLPIISSDYDNEYEELCKTEDAIKKRKAEIKDIMVRSANGRASRSRLFTVKPSSQDRIDWRKYAEELDPEGVHKPDFVKRLDMWTVRGIKRRAK